MPVPPQQAPRKSPVKKPLPPLPPQTQKTYIRKASEATILEALKGSEPKKPQLPPQKKPSIPSKKPQIPSSTTSTISTTAPPPKPKPPLKPKPPPNPKGKLLIHDQYPPGHTRQSAFEHHISKEPVPIQAKNWCCVSILLFTTLTVFYTLLSISAKSGGFSKDPLHEENFTEEQPLNLRCVGGDTKDSLSILALFMNPLGCLIHWFGCLYFQKAVDLGRHRDPDYRIKHIRWYVYSMLGPIGSIALVFAIKVDKCRNSGLFWIFTVFELAGMSALLFWGWRMAKAYMYWLKHPDFTDLVISDEGDDYNSRSPSPTSMLSTTSGKSTTTEASLITEYDGHGHGFYRVPSKR